MRDVYIRSRDERWYYRRGWFNPHVTKSSRCWKDQGKRRHQYCRTPTIDLYERYERDECGIIVTDDDIEQMLYLFSTYRCVTI